MQRVLYLSMLLAVSIGAAPLGAVSIASEPAEIWTETRGRPDRRDSPQGVSRAFEGGICFSGSDFTTTTLNAQGKSLWTQKFDGPDWENSGPEDIARNPDVIRRPDAVAADFQDDIIVTGHASVGLYSWVTTVKYAAQSGHQLWTAQYYGEELRAHTAEDIATDKDGNIYIVGTSTPYLSELFDVTYALVLKYSPSGELLWSTIWKGPESRTTGKLIATADDGTIRICGTTEGKLTEDDIFLLSLDSDGNLLWEFFQDGFGFRDIPTAMVIGPDESTFITGYTRSTGRDVFFSDDDIITLKVDETGMLGWVTLYDGRDWSSKCGFTSLDVSNDIALDSLNRVVIAGYTTRRRSGVFYGDCNSAPDHDYVTIQYSSEGAENWVEFFHCSQRDFGRNLSLDSEDSIYVTGGTLTCNSQTVKYRFSGEQLWVTESEGRSEFVETVNTHDAYLVGSFDVDTIDRDIFVTRFGAKTFLRGDCNGDGRVAGSVSDALFILNRNFLGGSQAPCLAACDADGDGSVDGQVTDGVYLLQYAFLSGPPPGQPFPECGPLQEADAALSCQTVSPVCGI